MLTFRFTDFRLLQVCRIIMGLVIQFGLAYLQVAGCKKRALVVLLPSNGYRLSLTTKLNPVTDVQNITKFVAPFVGWILHTACACSTIAHEQ